jgi:hypothetical protein
VSWAATDPIELRPFGETHVKTRLERRASQRPRPARLLSIVFLAFLPLLLIAAPHAAFGQETREHDFTDLDRDVGLLKHVKLRLKLANRFIGQADFGSFEAVSYQPEGRLKLTVPVAKNAGLRLLGTGRVIIYDFDGASNLAGDSPGSEDPFGSLNSWTLRLQGAYFLDEDVTLFSDKERWSILVDVFGKARWESGSDLSDALTWGGTLALGYKLAERLEVAAGLSIRTRLLRDGIGVSPLIEVDWRINDDWRLRSYGVGLELERRLTERFRLFARARLEGRSYRLEDRGGTIGKGRIQVRQLPTGLGFRWDLTRRFRLTAALGAIAYHRLRVKSEDDETIGSETADPSPYVMIRFELRP